MQNKIQKLIEELDDRVRYLQEVAQLESKYNHDSIANNVDARKCELEDVIPKLQKILNEAPVCDGTK